jgi:hypothetical protein
MMPEHVFEGAQLWPRRFRTGKMLTLALREVLSKLKAFMKYALSHRGKRALGSSQLIPGKTDPLPSYRASYI